MGSAHEETNAARAWLAFGAAFLATAALVYFGNGLMPRWPLMWIAPLPAALYALRHRAWQAGLLAGGAWLAGCLNLWHYVQVLGSPPSTWFIGGGMIALAFALSMLLMRALAGRGALWSAWLALPAAWITFEFVRNLLWMNGSSTCLAYSQLNFLPFLQTASLAGPWGMGFVLMLFSSGLALGIDRWRADGRRAKRILGATLSITLALLIFGAMRLAMSPAVPQPDVKVGLIASDANGGAQVEGPGAPTRQLFRDYAQVARRLIARGAQVVVMPEHMGVVSDADIAKTDAIFQPIADQTGAVLVVGMAHETPTAAYNQARVYAPHVPVRSYDKEHLLAPYETRLFVTGKERLTFHPPGKIANETWAVAICKDLDFTNPARAYGRAGTGLLLAPAWDFGVDGFYHGHMAVMRAVEDGFSLVRSARRGLLTVADNRGRILAERRSSAAPFVTLVATVPAGHSETLFLLLGDWFGWCAVAIFLFVAVRLTVISLRAKKPSSDAAQAAS